MIDHVLKVTGAIEDLQERLVFAQVRGTLLLETERTGTRYSGIVVIESDETAFFDLGWLVTSEGRRFLIQRSNRSVRSILIFGAERP
ncbi:MAG: hypothetical protein KF847_20380 [Pirellulales bacterium]|nr:hypothetical protein [Pirellulales bacterium]